MTDEPICIATVKIRLSGSGYEQLKWSRTVEVPDDITFYDLHCIIQDLLNFDNDHMYEFFGGPRWNKRALAIGAAATPDDPGQYDRMMLFDILPLEDKLKLFYIFDFGDSWIFSISCVRGRKPIHKNAKYPRVVEKIGRALRQYQ